jgi:predicted metal-dependent enzyme (double-stranded beta helix superfamily)
LIDVARSLADGGSWRRTLAVPQTGRATRLLAVTDAYEAWLIHWAPGGDIALHDHGESSGALWLVRGELGETYGSRVARGAMRGRILDAGTGITFDRDHVHDVINPGPQPATSIHVYSPHLSAMTFYDLDLRPLRTEPLVLGQHVG